MMKYLKRIAAVALVGASFSWFAPHAEAKPKSNRAHGERKTKRWKPSWGRNSSARYRTIYRGNRNYYGNTNGQRFYYRRTPYRVNGVIRYRTQRVYY